MVHTPYISCNAREIRREAMKNALTTRLNYLDLKEFPNYHYVIFVFLSCVRYYWHKIMSSFHHTSLEGKPGKTDELTCSTYLDFSKSVCQWINSILKKHSVIVEVAWVVVWLKTQQLLYLLMKCVANERRMAKDAHRFLNNMLPPVIIQYV